MNLQELRAFVSQNAHLHARISETTILNAGGRGYYENPFSELLAFFLNPNSGHTLGNLVLASLLDMLGQDVAQWPRALDSDPIRETNGRIDIVLKGPGWAIALENKIHHAPNNPFDTYVDALGNRFPGIPQNMRKHIILAPYNPNIDNWIWIDTKEFISKIWQNSGPYFRESGSSKWPALLRELLVTIEGEMEVCMNNETFDLILAEYHKFFEVVKLYSAFKTRFCEKLAALIHDVANTRISVREWGWDGTAFRVFLNQGQANVSLILMPAPPVPNEKFRIQIYVPNNLPDAQRAERDLLFRGQEGDLRVYSRDFDNIDQTFLFFQQALQIVVRNVNTEQNVNA